MRDLYQMFGDWYLVMAAYNSGPLNVSRAIERTGYADYWDLKRLKALPRETENYVPIIIALALVAKDPSLYGVHVEPAKPPQIETHKIGASRGSSSGCGRDRHRYRRFAAAESATAPQRDAKRSELRIEDADGHY